MKLFIHDYEHQIDPYPIGGVKANEVAIVCTGHGLLLRKSKEGTIIMIRKMYYADVYGTIISPTTVVQQRHDVYQGFTIDSDCDNGVDILKLKNRDDTHHHTFDMTLGNVFFGITATIIATISHHQ